VSAGCLLMFILTLDYYLTPGSWWTARPDVELLTAYSANRPRPGMATGARVLLGLALILYAVLSVSTNRTTSRATMGI
jgi:hypothetical protein